MQQGAPKITAKSTMQQQRIPRNTKYRRKEHQEQQRTLRRAHDMAEKSTKKQQRQQKNDLGAQQMVGKTTKKHDRARQSTTTAGKTTYSLTLTVSYYKLLYFPMVSFTTFYYELL